MGEFYTFYGLILPSVGLCSAVALTIVIWDEWRPLICLFYHLIWLGRCSLCCYHLCWPSRALAAALWRRIQWLPHQQPTRCTDRSQGDPPAYPVDRIGPSFRKIISKVGWTRVDLSWPNLLIELSFTRKLIRLDSFGKSCLDSTVKPASIYLTNDINIIRDQQLDHPFCSRSSSAFTAALKKDDSECRWVCMSANDFDYNPWSIFLPINCGPQKLNWGWKIGTPSYM